MSFEVLQSEVNDFDALGTLSYQPYPKLLNSLNEINEIIEYKLTKNS